MKKIILSVLILSVAFHLKAQVKVNDELKGLINQSFGYFPKVKEVERGIIVDDLGRNDADIMNLENSLEIRKKNPCLFSRTPLANIRKNTLSSEK
jgi:hypothetical protein